MYHARSDCNPGAVAGAGRGCHPLLEAVRDSAPVSLSIAAYGVVFGTLARQAGLATLDVMAMSALVFSGSAQFVALPLLQADTAPFELFLTTFLLSLRHLVMGLSLAPGVRRLGAGYRCLLAYGLNDEAYALTTRRAAQRGFDPAYMLGTGLSTFVAWVGGTVLGTLPSRLVTDPRQWGLDFAFPAVFIALLVPQVKGRAGLTAVLAGATVALLTVPFLGTGASVLAAALAAAVTGGALDREP
ncbi:MAG TPA: AzlC family ABC transporter permease [Firmicutes bacterium]|nr:AzlC family ABC transporter permease [Bacillota bacterium]